MESETADVIGATLVGLFIWVRYVSRVKGKLQTSGPFHRRLVAGWVSGDRYVVSTPQKDLYEEDISDDSYIGLAAISDLVGDHFYYVPSHLDVFGIHDWEVKPSKDEQKQILEAAAKEVSRIRVEEKI